MAFMTQTFNQASVIARYYANTAAYAKNCENKAKPQMQCNGKCQMLKKLKKASQEDQQNTERTGGSSKNEVLSSRSHFASIPCINQVLSKAYHAFCVSKLSTITTSIFHPPGYFLA